MILPLAEELGGTRPPPGRARTSPQHRQTVRRRSLNTFLASPASPLSHSTPWHEAAGQAGAVQDSDTQSQGMSPNSAPLRRRVSGDGLA